MINNPYETLGVGSNAAPSEIKKAYKKEAAKTHPDKQGGDNSKFLDVKLAYDILGDKAKRERYDRTGDIEESKPKSNPVDDRIKQIFSTIISDENFSGDMIATAVDMAQTAIGNLANKATLTDTKLQSLKQCVERISCESELDIFNPMLNQRIAELERAVIEINNEHDVMMKVIERLGEYKDKSPQENSWASGKWGGL